MSLAEPTGNAIPPSCHETANSLMDGQSKHSDVMAHSDHSQTMFADTSNDSAVFEQNCCDGNCAMLGCHATGFVQSTPFVMTMPALAIQHDFFISPSLSKRSELLLRPPITTFPQIA